MSLCIHLLLIPRKPSANLGSEYVLDKITQIWHHICQLSNHLSGIFHIERAYLIFFDADTDGRSERAFIRHTH